jgi:hypothetical protein
MLRLRFLLSLIFALASGYSFAQTVVDDFNDGTFTAPPITWTGTDTEWAVVGNRLNINASATNINNYLSTPFAVPLLDSASWEFDVEFTVASATANNYAEIFLTSDLSDVSGNVNGYFVRVNNNQQEISLWRSSNGSNSKIIDGADLVTATNLAFRIRVTRSATGDWSLFQDATVTGNNYVLEGTVNDVTFTSSAFFGILERHTAASRNQWFFCDNINVQNFAALDVTPPTILSSNVVTNMQLEVLFSEFVDVTTATTAPNYNAGGQTPSNATISASDSARVVLNFANPFANCVTETLIVQNVADRSANVMVPDTSTYIDCVTQPAAFRDVVINEIFADPTPQVCGHPNAEFVELFNRGTNPVNLKDWKFQDPTASVTITTTNYILNPGEYVILSDSIAWSAFGPTIAMSLPTLTNSGEALGLRDDNFILIDTATFDDTMYATGMSDGYGLEVINPDISCLGAANWSSSTDPCQTTPGAQNSIYDPTPDTQAPTITGLTVTGANTLQVCFSEPLDSAAATVAANYSVAGIGTATAAVVSPDFLCVNLTLPGNINSGTLYTLVANGVQDCIGNIGSDSIDFLISGPASPGDILINEIYHLPLASNTNIPNSEYVELYNRSNNIYDLAGWTFADRGTPKTLTNYTLQPGAYVVLCHIDSVGLFSGIPVLGVTSFPNLNSTDDDLGIRDGTGQLIDTVQYTLADYQSTVKDDGGWSLELINPEDTCSQFNRWIASNSANGGTPGLQNSVYDITPDITPPQLLSITVTSPTFIEVCFNETMSPAVLQNLSNYTIDNGMSVVAAGPGGPGLSCVTLILSMPIDTGTIYTLTMDVADCSGNLATLSGTFVQGGASVPYQIVINEIFADESPVVGLPESEFVELFNNGPTAVDLSGWTFTDGTSSVATLPTFTLLPDSFVILCAIADQADYAAFGTALGLSSFPSLNQGGDNLEIYDASNTLIDFVYYEDSWYRDTEKDDGGWSIERIDPEFACLNAENWRASEDTSGGTPGRENSVKGTFIDLVPPTLISAFPTSGGSLVHVEFSEIMDEFGLLDVSQYTITPAIGILGVLTSGPTSTGIDLMLQGSLQPRIVYCLTVNGVEDCAGNPMLNQEICFGLAEPIEPGDVILNEILFNPTSGGSRFVELYNLSDKVVDLSTLFISRRDLIYDTLYSTDIIATTSLLMLPGTYIALTEDKDSTLSRYQPIDPAAVYEVGDLPSFGNHDICVIWTDSMLVIDELHYDDAWHFPNLDDDDGVSLERIDFNRATQDENNWHSAASIVNYGTPGYRNSQVLVPAGPDEVWLQPETFSPDQDGLDDHLAINYKFPEPGWNVKVSVFDNKGRLIRIVQENILVGTEDADGTFKWDGTNETGNKAGIGVYVVLVEATHPTSGETKHFKLGCVLAARL